MASETKHTPGPWGTNGSHIYAPDGAIIAVVHNPGSKESDYPLAANRDLIAAAPGLLAILQSILVHGELACVDAGGRSWGSSGKKPPSKDVFQFPRHMLTDIEAAIAKATL